MYERFHYGKVYGVGFSICIYKRTVIENYTSSDDYENGLVSFNKFSAEALCDIFIIHKTKQSILQFQITKRNIFRDYMTREQLSLNKILLLHLKDFLVKAKNKSTKRMTCTKVVVTRGGGGKDEHTSVSS
jgi:hypothetical protein